MNAEEADASEAGALETSNAETGAAETSAPPASSPAARSRARRLHPASLILNLGGAAGRLLLPLLLVFFVANNDRTEFFLAVLVLPMAAHELIRFFTVRYRMEADEIIVTMGLFTRSERHIPFARIQNIDLVQSLAHRMLGVAEVRIETASGSEPEAVLKVLSLRAVEEMRAQIFHATPGQESDAAPAENAPEPLLRLGIAELIRLGLISNHGLAVVAAAWAAAWEFDLFKKIPNPADTFPEAEHWLSDHWLAAALALLGVLVGTIVVLSIGWSVVRMYNFRLDRHGDDLRLSCGLLTRLSATVPISRIQCVSVHESLFHRLLRRRTVRVETAGGGGEERDTNISRRWVVPLCPSSRSAEFVEILQPGTGVDSLRWRPLAPAGRRRLLRRRLIQSLLITLAACVISRPAGLVAALTLVPWFWLLARREANYLAWARTPLGIAYRSGAWTRRLSCAPFSRLQTVSVLANPFDRRNGMASVRVDTAGAGPAGHSIHIPYLPRKVAERLGRALSQRAESAGFSWSIRTPEAVV